MKIDRGRIALQVRRAFAMVAETVSLNDVHAYAGVVMIGYGLNLMIPGAGWAAAGAILVWLGLRR